MKDSNNDAQLKKPSLGYSEAHLKAVHPSYHYKYCPRCAAPGNFNHEKLSFKCKACGFHFFLNSAAAVMAVIFNDRGELLMVKRGVEPSIGMYDLPGGFVDPGESAETALFREIGEELDLVPDSLSFYATFPNQYFFSGTVVHTIDLVFKCKVTDFSRLKFRDDIMGIEFIKLEKINFDLVPFVSVKNLLKKLNNEQNHHLTD